VIKKRLLNNWGYKVLSLVLAILAWMVVISIEDPVATREFSDIPVVEMNASLITDAGKAYSYVNGKNTVSVRVKGRSSVINSLKRDDFKAVADLSKLSITGAVSVDVTCPSYSGLEISPVGSSTVVNLKVEDLLEKSLNVQVLTRGKVSSDKYIGKGTAAPNLITVSGPASEIRMVDSAIVYVPVSSSTTEDIETEADLILRDSDGREISGSNIKVSQSKIQVKLPIYNEKTVPVEFAVTGAPADGYVAVSTDYEPKEVTIAGPDSELAQVDQITIGSYDISGKNGKIESSISIAKNMEESLPEHVVLVDSEAEVSFMVDIQKVEQKTIQLPVSQISTESVREGYDCSISDGDSDVIPIVLKGNSEALQSLDEDTLKASVNLNGYREGTYTIPVDCDLPEGAAVVNSPTVSVEIREEESDSQR